MTTGPTLIITRRTTVLVKHRLLRIRTQNAALKFSLQVSNIDPRLIRRRPILNPRTKLVEEADREA